MDMIFGEAIFLVHLGEVGGSKIVGMEPIIRVETMMEVQSVDWNGQEWQLEDRRELSSSV